MASSAKMRALHSAVLGTVMVLFCQACARKSASESSPVDSPRAAVKGSKPYKPEFVPLALGPVMPKSILKKKTTSLRLTTVTRDTTIAATTESAEGITQITAGMRLLRQALGLAAQELVLFDAARVKITDYCETKGGNGWTTCNIADTAITVYYTAEMLAYVLDQMGDDSASEADLKVLNDKVGERVPLKEMNFSRVSDGIFDYTLEYKADGTNTHTYRWDSKRTVFELGMNFDGVSDSGNDFEGMFKARFDATDKVTTFRATGNDGPDVIHFAATMQSTGGANDEVIFSTALNQLVAGYGTIAFSSDGAANTDGGQAESVYAFSELSGITATASAALTADKSYVFAPSNGATADFAWTKALGSGTVDSANTSSFKSDGFAYWGPSSPPSAMKIFSCGTNDQSRLTDCADSGATLSLSLTRTVTRYFYTSQWDGNGDGTYYCARTSGTGSCDGSSGTNSATYSELYTAKVGDSIAYSGDIAASISGADEVSLGGKDFVIVDKNAVDLTTVSPLDTDEYADHILATGIFTSDPAALSVFNGLNNYMVNSSILATSELTDALMYTYSFDSNGARVFTAVTGVTISSAED